MSFPHQIAILSGSRKEKAWRLVFFGITTVGGRPRMQTLKFEPNINNYNIRSNNDV